MRKVRITGGPTAASIRVALVDEDGTEHDVTEHFFKLEYLVDSHAPEGKSLAIAHLTAFAEVDLVASAAVMVRCARADGRVWNGSEWVAPEPPTPMGGEGAPPAR